MSKFLFAVCFALFAAVFSETAQAQDAEEKSTFTRYVEDTLSSENFKIKLNGLEGTLSSNVSLASITIADKQGIWITIVKPQLVWSRTALLTGRVEVESLTAEQIVMPRSPLPDESSPTVEATPFKLPDLPVSINIQKLSIGEMSFEQAVFGLAAKASLEGKLSLAGGALDLDILVDRLDGAGGSLKAIASYVEQSQKINLDIALSEPENGIVANLLKIEDTPPVALSIKGEAPLKDLAVDIQFDVAGRRILTGDVNLSKPNSGTLVNANLNGPLASILPEQHRAFFGLESILDARVLLPEVGGVNVEALSLKSGAIDLSAEAKTLADGFLSDLKVKFELSNPDGSRVVFPQSSDPASVDNISLRIDYDAAANNNWRADLNAAGFAQAGIKTRDLTLNGQGIVTNVDDPASRSITFTVGGLLDGFSSNDIAVSEAMGSKVNLSSNGRWQAGQPLILSNLNVVGDTFKFTSDGEFADFIYSGSMKLVADRLSAFSSLADRSLRGRADLGTQGTINLLSGGFDLKVDGTTVGLAIGQDNVDPLLKGITTLSGGMARDENGLAFNDLRLANSTFNTELKGRYSSKMSDVSIDALIKDISDVTSAGTGELSLRATLNGDGGPQVAKAMLSLQTGELQGRQVQDLALVFDGTIAEERLNGIVSGNGKLDENPVKLDAQIDRTPDTLSMSDLAVIVGDTRLNGQLAQDKSELWKGEFDIDSTSIGDAAALALVDASGAVSGTFKLFPTDELQSLQTNLSVRNLRYETTKIGSAEIVAAVVDVLGEPKIGATINGKNIQIGNNRINSVDAKIDTNGNATGFDLEAVLAQNAARVKTTGNVQQDNGETEIVLATLSADTNIADVRLQSPATISIKDGITQLTTINLTVGTGAISVSGSAGSTLNLDVVLRNLPLALANTIQSNLGAAGTLSGTAAIGGTTDKPVVEFTATGQDISSTQLANAGLTPLRVSANGTFANDTVSLTNARAVNSQNLSIDASGRIPLKGQGLSLRVNGLAPLSLAEGALADRGAKLSGQARFDVTVTGALSDPRPSGILSIENASLTDPLSNLKLTNIGLLAGITANEVTINRGNAALSSGGTISMSGSVGLSGNLPANIAIALKNARYTDGKTFDAKASGQLTVKGPLLQSPVLGGEITLERTEILIPENFASDNDLLKVDHINPSAKVRATLDRLARSQPKATPRQRPSVLQLDLTINAPNQIFVRGRGLDAELSGRIRITGPITNVSPQGSFNLRRGRLSILGQRLDLTEGTVSLSGDLDPFVNLVAETRSGDVVAFINVQGRTSDIKITFSSSPELPQDEVLAQIIFGRGITDLSPTQIARLASAAAELTGGNSPGLVDSIRQGTGLDDLDVVQDSDGNAAVKGGKYISDNVYLGVQAGSKAEVTINLDITDNVKARGAIDSEGDASLGIFLEKDY